MKFLSVKNGASNTTVSNTAVTRSTKACDRRVLNAVLLWGSVVSLTVLWWEPAAIWFGRVASTKNGKDGSGLQQEQALRIRQGTLSARQQSANRNKLKTSLNHNQAPAISAGEFDPETGFYQSIALMDEEPVVSRQSKYQQIAVHRSKHFGKVLVLDGVTQVTEKDGDSYNEMMAHVPLFQHEHPVRVLLIGGGDGYVLSEILKHPSVEHVDHVELDLDVIQVCKEHFQWGKQAWKDPRVRLHITDGATFVQHTVANFYDVIIQDSSDPWTWDENGSSKVLPSSVLYSAEHFQAIFRALTPTGIFSFQAETYHFPADLAGMVSWRQQALKTGFARVRYGTISIATYPMGQIGFLMCEKSSGTVATNGIGGAGGTTSIEFDAKNYGKIEQRYLEMKQAGKGTSYYHPRLHISAFDLPLWVEKRIYSDIQGSVRSS